MCRTASRGDAQDLPKEIIDKGFELRRKVEQSSFWDNMITLNSTQLGDTAPDENSFSQNFLKYIPD